MILIKTALPEFSDDVLLSFKFDEYEYIEGDKEKYNLLGKKHSAAYRRINAQFNVVSILRLITGISFIAALYFYLKTSHPALLLSLFAVVALFLVLIKVHDKLSFRRKISSALININTDEINYLTEKKLPFPDGSVYINPAHAYSYDLDMFGQKSMFHILNRTATSIGEIKLAESLLTLLPHPDILLNQAAIQELSSEIEWRQEVFAIGRITNDSKEAYENLIKWSKTKSNKISPAWIVFSFLSPAAIVISLVMYSLDGGSGFGNIALYLFIANLLVLFIQRKQIKSELLGSSKIDEVIKNYGLIIQLIENKNFKTDKLRGLQDRLNNKTGFASKQIKKLSVLYSQLENIQNPIGALLVNGFFLYHIHTLRRLISWKNNYSARISDWLHVIGEFEMLSSFANFSFNNPAFTYPLLNTNFQFNFRDLGHPLINENNRVNNDLEFTEHKFMILTGSNMSGKSTFLRSLGINMVLAGTGSPICASSANIHPLNVSVSMRLSDSLNDNESYFFAEVKRLKEIMDQADKEISFILLDEILRGTNSDDKRTGTVEVIKKIISKNAIGAIATHDLKVCSITDAYPGQLVNKCFEVEIINNELSFDYKLRDGICKNKSATFLMKKMQVI